MAEPATPSGPLHKPDSTRQAVLRLQRGVQRRMQAEVRAYTGGNSPAIERYYREYMREFRRFQGVSSYGELHDTLLDSDLVFIGDYHTLRKSQEVALQLLERAAADPRPVCLALEMVQEEHQGALDAYMSGALSEEDFLRAVHYERTWNFNWENYKPLFEAARDLGVRLYAINHAGRGGPDRIRQRDSRIAERLVHLLGEESGSRILVLIGDLHLASNHLPQALDRRLEKANLQPRRLIVYQNSDTLYWTLAQEGSEIETQVVRLGQDRYCVMEVPPYVKLQSYLSWETVEQSEPETEPTQEVSEPTGHSVLSHLVTQLCAFFGQPTFDVQGEVYTNLDENFFEALRTAESLGEERRREIHLHAFANRSLCVPELALVYLPYFSVNHAAEEAMHLIMLKLEAYRPLVGEPYEDFYGRVLWSAMGYAASKIVNPRRLATTEEEFRLFNKTTSRKLHDPELAFRKLVAHFVLQHKQHEAVRRASRCGRLKQIYDQDLEVSLEVALALGYMLGEELARALREGRIGRDEVRRFAFSPNGTSASERYFEIADRLASKSTKKNERPAG